MKRSLVVLLTIAVLLFAFAGVASAFSDVPSDHKAAGDIAKMNALSIIEGYPDGTFKPDGQITRAEFAKIAVIVAGLENSAQMLQNTPSRFSDVQAGVWYTGWINLAEARGYVKGYPDGAFKPNNNISYSEVITVLLRIVGYNDNLPGSWPVNYLAKATELGITDRLSFDASKPATRADVMILANETLSEEIVKWLASDQIFDGTGEKLIEKIYKGSFFEDALVTGWTFENDRYRIAVAGDGSKRFAKSFALANVGHVMGLSDQFIDYITNKDGDIIYAESKNYGRIQRTASDTSSYGSSDRAKVSFNMTSGNKPTRVIVDDKEYRLAATAYYKDTVIGTTHGGQVYWGQAVRLVQNKDGDIALVREINDGPYLMVDRVIESTPRLVAKTGGNQGANLTSFNADIRDTNKVWAVFKGGKEVGIAELKEFDIARLTPNGNGYDWKVDVSISKVTGVLETIEYNVDSDDNQQVRRARVAGQRYDMATNGTAMRTLISEDEGETFNTLVGNAGTLEDMLGKEVTFYLNGWGSVEFIVGSDKAASAYIWGVVDDVEFLTAWSGNPPTQQPTGVSRVTVFTAEGKFVTYETDSKSKINNKDARKADAIGEVVPGQLVKLSLNSSSKINNMYSVSSDIVNSTITGVNKDNNTIRIDGIWRTVTSDSVIFNVEYDGVNYDDVDLATRKELIDFLDGISGSISVSVQVKYDGSRVQYLVISEDLVTKSDFAVVTGKGKNADGDYLDINILGSVKRINADSVGNFGDVRSDDFVAYTMSGNDLKTVVRVVYGSAPEKTIESINYSTKAVKIDGVWYFIDSDTVIYRIGDNVEYVDINDIYEGDIVRLPNPGYYADHAMADSNNVLRYLIIKD